MLTLDALGWSPFFQRQRSGHPDATPARVVVEYQDRYRLLDAEGPLWAQLSGALRRETEHDRLSRPAVGDWVLVRNAHSQDMGTVVALLDRTSCFVRQAAGRRTSAQVVAANIDTVFVVTSFNRDFNPRRIERYLTTVSSSGARPVIVLNKLDLCDDPAPYRAELEAVAPGAAVAMVSALERRGLDALLGHVRPGETVALVGSSGVGKSMLVNWLLGDEVQRVGAIREHDARGRHTTTHRELFVMPGGGVLIDTPGMRELKLWSAGPGLHEAFPDVEAVAARCRFRDCAHEHEPGCAVREAARAGELDRARVTGYLKLLHERRDKAPDNSHGARRRGKRGARAMRPRRIRGR